MQFIVIISLIRNIHMQYFERTILEKPPNHFTPEIFKFNKTLITYSVLVQLNNVIEMWEDT